MAKTNAQVTKTEDGKSYTADAYLIVGDPEKPSTWDVRVRESDGAITLAGLGRAAAAITTGFQGNKVELAEDVLESARRRLVTLYREAKAEPPDGLREAIREEYDTPVSSKRLVEQSGDLAEACLEVVGEGQPVIRDVTLIKPGLSLNRRFYSEEVLKTKAPHVFEGVPAFVTNHVAEQKSLRNLAGVWRNVRYVEGTGVVGDLYGLKSETQLLEKAIEAHKELGADKVGPSIDTPGKVSRKATPEGFQCIVEDMYRTKQTSIDIVINPAAGGRLAEAVEEEDEGMKVSDLTAEVLANMGTVAVRALCEGVTEDEIRQLNPNLADAIVAKLQEKEEGAEVKEEAKTPEAAEAESKQEEVKESVATTPEVKVPSAEEIQRMVEAQVAEQIRVATAAATKKALLDTKLSEAKLGEIGEELIRAKFEGKDYTEEELDEQIRIVRDKMGKAAPNTPFVPGTGTVQVTEQFDVLKARLEAACTRQAYVQVNGKNYPRFNSISQAIMAFHPEMMREFVERPQQAALDALQYFQWGGGPVENYLSEAVQVGTFNDAWADVLNRVLMRTIEDPQLNTWRNFISDVINFRDLTVSYKFVRVGELGTVPTVAEGGTYQPTAAPSDEKQEVAIEKKGFLYPLTWEAILRDDINVLARIPRDLGRAWAWTVYDTVFGLFTSANGDGATIDADGKALYDAAHNNSGSTAFSAAALETARAKMPRQTDISSGKRKNYRARFLLYATPDLDQAVWEVINSAFKTGLTTNIGEINLPNYARTVLGLEAIPVIYPDGSTTRWELVADPADAHTVAVGFLGGREVPDVVIQDQEAVGSRFTSDTVTYKLRGTVGAAVLDYRSFVRGNK